MLFDMLLLFVCVCVFPLSMVLGMLLLSFDRRCNRNIVRFCFPVGGGARVRTPRAEAGKQAYSSFVVT